jgi:hypothetical protein
MNPIIHLIFIYYYKKNFSKIFELCYIHGNDPEVSRLCDHISIIQLYTYLTIFSIFIIIILMIKCINK